jgi:N-acetylglucosamine malate deacetylase 1
MFRSLQKLLKASEFLPLGMNDYLFGLESRDRFFGSLIGAHHGEAFVSEVPLKLGSLSDLPAIR